MKEDETMNENKDMMELDVSELDKVTGGASDAGQYAEAVCEHCGATGKHRMDSGWTAICRVCGKTINLKAQP